MSNGSVDDVGLKRIVNGAGFLFEMAVEHAVETAQSHWSLHARQHPYTDPVNGQPRFIDLVLAAGRQRLVIECKRPQDSRWVFVVPTGTKPQTDRIRIHWESSHPSEFNVAGVDEFRLFPQTPESSLCIMHGASRDQKAPLLERECATLLDACRALLDDEKTIGESTGRFGDLLAIPAIVTTAKLVVCTADPSEISLDTGKIEEPEFVEVPMVRFRKSFSVRFEPSALRQMETLRDANENRERTILVINAAALAGILRAWDLRPWDQFRHPWSVARLELNARMKTSAE